MASFLNSDSVVYNLRQTSPPASGQPEHIKLNFIYNYIYFLYMCVYVCISVYI